MSPVLFTFGAFRMAVVSDGTFALDGGAMFGRVPKPLWSRKLPADRRNRVRLGLNCLYVEAGSHRVLIEAGIGRKHSQKMKSIYAVDEAQTLAGDLAALGVLPEAIDDVIPTHLHLDHVGACTVRNAEGALVPAFPKARYLVQRGEWESATHPHELSRRSYLDEDFRPLAEHGRIRWLDGDGDVCDGVRVQVTGGHTKFHQIVVVESCGMRLVVLGDFIPTTAHLRIPWLSGLDEFPLETLERKRRMLEEFVEHGVWCFWSHDAATPLGRIRRAADGEYQVEPGLPGPVAETHPAARGRKPS